MRVLVVGASGALGRPTIKALLARGIAVRGVCRHPEAAADLAAAGAEIVAGDLADRASIERALAGTTRVLAAAHGLLGRGRWRSEAVDDAGHRDLIDAARAAGVERFVYTSASMAAPDHPIDFARTKYSIEQALAQSALTYAILRPTAFMEHHVHTFNGLNVLTKGKASPNSINAMADHAQSAAPVVPWVTDATWTMWLRNAVIEWADFWRTDLSAYDVVCAYLSPVPMPDLWQKVQREMRPGTLFISYRFAIPGVAPTQLVQLKDLGQTKLYVWRV